MGETATLAPEQQHLRPLQAANRVRLARAAMKREIAAGQLAAAEVILSCPWQAQSMSISDLLMSQKRWGRARCRRLLLSIGVPENKAVGHAHRTPARWRSRPCSGPRSARPAPAAPLSVA